MRDLKLNYFRENRLLDMSKYSIGDEILYSFHGFADIIDTIENIHFDEVTETCRYRVKNNGYWIPESFIKEVMSYALSHKQTFKNSSG